MINQFFSTSSAWLGNDETVVRETIEEVRAEFVKYNALMDADNQVAWEWYLSQWELIERGDIALEFEQWLSVADNTDNQNIVDFINSVVSE